MPERKDQERFIHIIVSVAALGGLLFGYDTGVISGAILFIKKSFSLSPQLQEIVVSAVLVGAVIGAVTGGRLADRFGRRRLIILSAVIFSIGAVATALTPLISLLIAGRIVVGIAIGIASFIAPMYISELAPARVRGSLVSVNQLAITVGIVVSYLVDYAFSGLGAWRMMLGLAAVPSIILALAMWRLPSSPRWLVARGSMDKARSVLGRIRRSSEIDAEVKEIKRSLEKQKGSGVLLSHPMLRMALFVGIGLAVFQQLTGINTVIYYAPTIFEFAGFKTGRTRSKHGSSTAGSELHRNTCRRSSTISTGREMPGHSRKTARDWDWRS